jgi:glycosyltransferase involved in cell wall biosynthesis
VVDNGSTDETKTACEAFLETLPLVYVFEKEIGIPLARNTGVRNATKDIFVFLDDDCVAERHWLAFMEAPFLRDKKLNYVGGEVTHSRDGKGIIEEFYRSHMSDTD